MSYFYFKVQIFHFKITSTLLSNREYIISSNNPIYLYWQEITFIKLNKNILYVNFIKRKENKYMIIPIIPIRGLLKTEQKSICI